jgi:hypothetical protein
MKRIKGESLGRRRKNSNRNWEGANVRREKYIRQLIIFNLFCFLTLLVKKDGAKFSELS